MRVQYDPNWWHMSFDPFLPLSVEPDLFVCKYSTFRQISVEAERLILAASSDGFTIRKGRSYVLCYNDAPDVPDTRKRFTLAHELGHYVLRHRTDGDKEEREANCFARNLLAPRLLAIDRGIEFADYPCAFGISRAAARLCEQKRDMDEQLADGLYRARRGGTT